MPNNGIPAPSTSRVTSTMWSAVAGSPGPLDRNTPSGLSSAICSKVADEGSTRVRTPRRAFGFHHVSVVGADLAGQIGTQHRLLTTHPFDQLLGRRERRTGEHAGLHRAAAAQMAYQRAGVDVGDADDLLADQLALQCSGGPPVRDPRRGIANHIAGHPDLVATALAVLTVPPGVADLRGGGHHDLPVIARVGQRLLIPGHTGGKDCLSQGLADRAERRPGEGATVIENQHRLHCATPSAPPCSHSLYSSRLLARNPVSILTPDGSRHRIARIPSRAATFPAMTCSVRMPEIDSLGIQIGCARMRCTRMPSGWRDSTALLRYPR